MNHRPARSAVSGPKQAPAGAAGLLVVVTLVWGTNYPVTRYVLTNGFEPLAFAASRFTVVATISCALALLRERSLRVSRNDLLLGAACAGLGIVVNQISLVYALSWTSASSVALLFGVVPAFVALFAHLARVEVVTRRAWAAAGVSLVGAALVAVGHQGRISANLTGSALALLAAACLAAYSVVARPLTDRYSPYRLTALLTVFGAVVLLAAGGHQLANEQWSKISISAWVAFGFTVLPAYVIANSIWLTAIKRAGPAKASLYMNMAPFVGTGISMAVLSETLTFLQVIGGAVVAMGILLSEWPRAGRVALTE